ncbi:MFS transporter [Ruminococcaceae bacterium OttesenSCG-928-L11]|nr:MFS transporter [Ruminococcaceae bacterium OttesenSCG-928-L11]
MFKKNALLQTLFSLKGNPKACVYTEPLWGIPHSLYSPFVSVYMAALLMTDRQIGLVASVTMFFRAISALLSGAITDKLGRRKATIIFDILSWSVPCLIWTFSQNFWWFMAASVFNGLWQITENSWTCLLVEDADKSAMVNIYSWVHMSGQLAVFFAPLSGLIVGKLTIIPAMRILYFFSFVSMTLKFLILYKFCDETQVGKIRKKETEGMSIFQIMSGYGGIVRQVAASGEMKLSLAITAFFMVTSMVMQNFFGLYTTQNLGVPEHFLALFPIIRSAILMVFLFVIQPRLARFGFKGPMLTGICLYIASHLVLIVSPTGNIVMPILYTALEACAHGLVMPRKDSISAMFIEPKERARIVSVMTVAVLGVTIPFGYISGWLSDWNRKLPFLLNIAIFILAFAVILTSRKLSKSHISKIAAKG